MLLTIGCMPPLYQNFAGRSPCHDRRSLGFNVRAVRTLAESDLAAVFPVLLSPHR